MDSPPRSDARVSEPFWHCVGASRSQRAETSPGWLMMREEAAKPGITGDLRPLKVFPSLLVGDHRQRLAKPLPCLLGTSAITRVGR